jgi:hypothetical protein
MKKKQFENRFFGRRQFLAGSGSMLLLPPLLSLMPDKVAAQVLSNPRRRSISWWGLNGIDAYQVFPGNQADLIPVAGAKSMGYKPLSSFAKGQSISRVIDTEFESMYQYMNLIQGMSYTSGIWNGGGHNSGALSSALRGERSPTQGASIDVVMENSPNVYKGEAIKHKTIRLSTRWTGDEAFSYKAVGGKYIPSEDFVQGDLQLFNKLFSGFTGGTAPASDSVLIVDKVKKDLDTLKQTNTRLSAADRVLLDSYINAVYELQTKVRAPAGASCFKPANFPFQCKKNGNGYNFPEGFGVTNTGLCYDNMIELIRLAFVCDLSRIVAIGNMLWSDAPEGDGGGYGTHHDCGGSDVNADHQKWGIKKFLKLGKALANTDDPFGGGKILDNTIMLYTNELGGWTTAHAVFNLPIITLGSCGGQIRTGNFIDCRQKPLRSIQGDYLGRPYKQLLQAIMMSMGVTKAEYSQWGDGKGFGEFQAGINQYNVNEPTAFAPYEAEHNDPLPFVKI